MYLVSDNFCFCVFILVFTKISSNFASYSTGPLVQSLSQVSSILLYFAIVRWLGHESIWVLAINSSICQKSTYGYFVYLGGTKFYLSLGPNFMTKNSCLKIHVYNHIQYFPSSKPWVLSLPNSNLLLMVVFPSYNCHLLATTLLIIIHLNFCTPEENSFSRIDFCNNRFFFFRLGYASWWLDQHRGRDSGFLVSFTRQGIPVPEKLKVINLNCKAKEYKSKNIKLFLDHKVNFPNLNTGHSIRAYFQS